MNARGVAVLMQLARTHVKGQCHGIGRQAQAVLARDLAGGRAEVIQVVIAFFELVLQRHGTSFVWRILEGIPPF